MLLVPAGTTPEAGLGRKGPFNRATLTRSIGIISIGLWFAIISALAVLAAAQLNNRYYELHPFLGDTASFLSSHFGLWAEIGTSPKSQVLWEHFIIERKNPALYLSYIFLPRDALASVNGHLPFTAVSLWCFLSTFSVTLYRRTHSYLYAAVAPLILFGFIGLYDPTYQIPSSLADPPAVFFFGAAVFAIFASKGCRSMPWLTIAGIFIAITVLSRFTSAGYIFFAAFPILSFYWIRLFLYKEYALTIKGIICITVPILIISGYHLVNYVVPTVEYYALAGYGLNKGISAALATTGYKFISVYVQTWGFLISFIWASIYIFLYRHYRDGWCDTFITLWATIAHPILIIIVLTVEDDAPQMFYMIGPFLLLAAAPFRLDPAKVPPQISPAALALATAPVLLINAGNVSFAAAPRFYAENLLGTDFNYRPFNLAAADVIERFWLGLGRPVTFDTAFDYYWRYLQPTSYQQSGAIALTARRFEIRQEQWPERRGMGPFDDGYADFATQEMLQYYAANADLLFVLKDPESESARLALKDDFTVDMAKRLLRALSTAPSWELYDFKMSPYGSVEIWRNIQRAD